MRAIEVQERHGGLGYKDLIAFNKAMLDKQAWCLAQTPYSLWVQIFKALYFHQGDVWQAKKGHRPSWGWLSLLARRDVIASETRWPVGDGANIKIREDKSLPSSKFEGLAMQSEPRLVAELIIQETREWKFQLIAELSGEDIG